MSKMFGCSQNFKSSSAFWVAAMAYPRSVVDSLLALLAWGSLHRDLIKSSFPVYGVRPNLQMNTNSTLYEILKSYIT